MFSNSKAKKGLLQKNIYACRCKMSELDLLIVYALCKTIWYGLLSYMHGVAEAIRFVFVCITALLSKLRIKTTMEQKTFICIKNGLLDKLTSNWQQITINDAFWMGQTTNFLFCIALCLLARTYKMDIIINQRFFNLLSLSSPAKKTMATMKKATLKW